MDDTKRQEIGTYRLEESKKGEPLSALLQEGREVLKKAGISDWDYDSRQLLFWSCHLTYMDFLMEPNRLIEQEKATQYREYMKKRASHIPLQYLMGECEFMGLPFFVDENVLIPRQDTEVLIEWIVDREKEKIESDFRLLDVCTGSGCIAISLAVFLEKGQNHPVVQRDTQVDMEANTQKDMQIDIHRDIKNNIHIDALDISEPALQVAKKNAARNKKENQNPIHFFQSNMFQNVQGQYDVIVSNPPYIPSAVVDNLMEEVKNHEPRLALDGTEDGLAFYRILADESKHYLKSGGRLYLEIGHDQGCSVPALLSKAGFIHIEVKKDLAGNDRAVAAVFP